MFFPFFFLWYEQGPRLKGEEQEAFEYHVALVRMLATCCEGDNRFIESMCQNIFRAKDLFPVRIVPVHQPYTRR